MATLLTRQDSKFFDTRLDNGLQLVGQQIPGVQSAASVFWVNTGTRDERLEEMGISHFLEHMAFRRTAHWTGEEVDRRFEEMGAEHNAGTWLEMTFYWARVLHEHVRPAIDLLSDLIHPLLDAEDFEAERPVILEEIARYEDMPAHILFNRFMSDFFGDHPLAWETLGTDSTIRSLSVDQMRDYWRQRYGANNIIFAIAGNFDWDQVVGQLQELTGGWEQGDAERRLSPVRPKPGLRVYQNEKFTQQQIAIGTPSVPQGDPRFYAAALLATIVGDDTGSRLFWSVEQTGLAESISTSTMEFEDNGLFLTHLATEPGLALRALETVQEELTKLRESEISADELERAKAKLNSSVVIGGESTNERVMGLIRSWLTYRRLETLEEVREKIEAVSLNDLHDLIEEFPLDRDQVITASGPLAPDALDGAA